MPVRCAEGVGSVLRGVGKHKWVYQLSVQVQVNSLTVRM